MVGICLPISAFAVCISFLMIAKQKESAKPSRNVHSGKPELMHHQLSFLPQTSLVLSATGSLELRLVSSAILEHTNNNTSHS